MLQHSINYINGRPKHQEHRPQQDPAPEDLSIYLLCTALFGAARATIRRARRLIIQLASNIWQHHQGPTIRLPVVAAFRGSSRSSRIPDSQSIVLNLGERQCADGNAGTSRVMLKPPCKLHHASGQLIQSMHGAHEPEVGRYMHDALQHVA